MKKLLYITGSRAEYGIMKRLVLALAEDNDIELKIIATGMHCDHKYGNTYKIIESDGLKIDKLIDIQINNNTNADVLQTMSRCQAIFGDYFEKNKFDAVMILGDRYEIFSVAIAAAIHNIPIIHLHGGEKTLGNYDEFIRHSITKMSRLHLASTEEYRQRIIQMGEDPVNVFNIGALGAENALLMNLPTKNDLEEKFGLLRNNYFVVVFHPETLNTKSPRKQVDELLAALERLVDKFDFIFIGSNSDTGADEITLGINAFCDKHDSRFRKSVSPEQYLALNKFSCGLIGNSSSGLIEIPSLNIPTINIGDRQKGRVRGFSVIDTECNSEDIFNSIIFSQTDEFRKIVMNSSNPYYSKSVMENAVKIIKNFLIEPRESYKDFFDISF